MISSFIKIEFIRFRREKNGHKGAINGFYGGYTVKFTKNAKFGVDAKGVSYNFKVKV